MKAAQHLALARLFGLESVLLLCIVVMAGSTPRIGLISLGKQDPNDTAATARFDYFRVYRP